MSGSFPPLLPPLTSHKLQTRCTTTAILVDLVARYMLLYLTLTSVTTPTPQPTLQGPELLDMAASHMKVKEKEYFGLFTEGDGCVCVCVCVCVCTQHASEAVFFQTIGLETG